MTGSRGFLSRDFGTLVDRYFGIFRNFVGTASGVKSHFPRAVSTRCPLITCEYVFNKKRSSKCRSQSTWLVDKIPSRGVSRCHNSNCSAGTLKKCRFSAIPFWLAYPDLQPGAHQFLGICNQTEKKLNFKLKGTYINIHKVRGECDGS